MVLQQGFEVFRAILREQEGVDFGAEFLEGEVIGGEEGAAGMIGAIEFFEETGFAQAEFEGAEGPWEQVDFSDSADGREDWGIDAVDYAVGAENVDGHDSADEVDRGASKAQAKGDALRHGLVGQVLAFEEGGRGVGEEDALSGAVVWVSKTRQQDWQY